MYVHLTADVPRPVYKEGRHLLYHDLPSPSVFVGAPTRVDLRTPTALSVSPFSLRHFPLPPPLLVLIRPGG